MIKIVFTISLFLISISSKADVGSINYSTGNIKCTGSSYEPNLLICNENSNNWIDVNNCQRHANYVCDSSNTSKQRKHYYSDSDSYKSTNDRSTECQFKVNNFIPVIFDSLGKKYKSTPFKQCKFIENPSIKGAKYTTVNLNGKFIIVRTKFDKIERFEINALSKRLGFSLRNILLNKFSSPKVKNTSGYGFTTSSFSWKVPNSGFCVSNKKLDAYLFENVDEDYYNYVSYNLYIGC